MSDTGTQTQTVSKPAARDRKVRRLTPGFGKDAHGATAIEYGLIAALIAVGILASLQSTGSAVKGAFQTVDDRYADVLNGN